MSLNLQNAVWKLDDLPHTKRIVLLRLAVYADENGYGEYPKWELLARRCGMSERTLRSVLQALEAEQLIRGRQAGEHRSKYRLTLDARKRHQVPNFELTETAPDADSTSETAPRADLADDQTAPRAENSALGAVSYDQYRISVVPQDRGSAREAPPRAASSLSRRQLLAHFDTFWSAYPRKVAREKALRAWLTLAPDEAACTLILAALQRQAASTQWHAENGRFVPYAARWLEERRWQDAPDNVGGRNAASAIDDEATAVSDRWRERRRPA